MQSTNDMKKALHKFFGEVNVLGYDPRFPGTYTIEFMFRGIKKTLYFESKRNFIRFYESTDN